jgi:hypothetical protein
MFILLAIYLGIIFSGVLYLNKQTALVLAATNMGIFLLGALIIAPGLNKDPETFVLRFLLLTTVQLLTIFGVIIALAFMKIPDAKAIGFHLAGLFFVLLIVQTVLLVKVNNATVAD